MTPTPAAPYVLGETDAEHERLIRQAAIFDPFTERLFLNAGIGPGKRVLDVGSGVGDVAILAAKLVGPTGEVVGVDRDANTLSKARSRVEEARLRNVCFMESDVRHIVSSELFDAVVGRLILQFLPNPSEVVRSLSTLVRPGGIIAFQECYWGPLLQLTAHLPLRAKCASLIYQTFQRSGVNVDMELLLYRVFLEAGLPAPKMLIEVPVGHDREISRWVYDIFCSLLPRMRQHDLSSEAVGDLGSLQSRLEAELTDMKTIGACIGLVGAWCQTPRSMQSAGANQ